MKKIFTLALAAFAVAFCSCSKDDNYSSHDILGKWETVKVVETYGPEKDVDDEFGEDYGYREIFEFFEDGTGSITEMEYYSGSWHNDTEYFDYSIKGNTVYISTYYSDYTEFKIQKLTSSELVVKASLKEDGATYTVTAYMKRIH